MFALFFLEWQTETWLWDFLLENKFSSSYLFLVSICTELPSPLEAMILEGRGYVSVILLFPLCASSSPCTKQTHNKGWLTEWMNGRLFGSTVHSLEEDLTLTFLSCLKDALPTENTMESDWQEQRIQLSQWAKHPLMRLARSLSCCCHYHCPSDSCSGRSRLGGKSQSVQGWTNQKDVLKDLLSDDRNRELKMMPELWVVLYLGGQ